MSRLDQTVDFEIIRYSNCWEDAEYLLKGLDLQPGDRVLSIASAGDNCLALLSESPSVVIAADLSYPQLLLTELKRTALAHLDYEDLPGFLGITEHPNRTSLYQHLRLHLQPSTRSYWDSHPALIEEGLADQGKLEKYFRLFTQKVLPLIHNQRTITRLLETKSPEDQRAFYDKKWNTWRWRMLFRIFFSRVVMARKGRDPEFLRQVDGPVHKQIFDQAEAHLMHEACTKNPFLRKILTGTFGDMLPPYLQPDRYEQIRKNLGALDIRHGYIHQLEAGSYDAFNLSDIFEYMDHATFQGTALALINQANPGARLAYWNLMAPRQISQILPESVQSGDVDFHRPDHGFFYRAFHVDRLQNDPQFTAVSSLNSNHSQS